MGYFERFVVVAATRFRRADCPLWEKNQREENRREWMGCYRCPRARASASARCASAFRSDSFLATQASQEFPDAVSSPVNAIEATSAYAISRRPPDSGNTCSRGF